MDPTRRHDVNNDRASAPNGISLKPREDFYT